MFKGIKVSEFRNKFSAEESCLTYLVDLKWSDGYCCTKCGHNQYYKGRKWHYRRCRKCYYDESATAGTIFHKCKLGLVRTFELAYRISLRKKGMSSCELAKELGCQQKTAWLWKTKYQEAMKSSEQYDLTGEVEVDEFMVGGFEQDAPGRTHGGKDIVVLAIERVKDEEGKETIGRAYARVVDNASSQSLKEIFDKHVDKDANVTTDCWRGYVPLEKEWKITQKRSEKGSNFKLLHTHIMNIKGWLRGIHHQCSAERLQSYLNEYHFRFNRRGAMKSIFHRLIEKCVAEKPMPYGKLRLCEVST